MKRFILAIILLTATVAYGATTSTKFPSQSIPEVGDAGTGWGTNLRGWMLSVDEYLFGVSINVKDYGAVGDGATDDTTAIQNAINAAELSSGIVVIPAGVYKYDSLTIDSDGVSLVGIQGAIFKQNASLSSSSHGIIISSASNIAINNLVVDGYADSQSNELRQIRIIGNSSNVLIDRVVVQNTLGVGLDIQGPSTKVRVVNSTFDNCKYGAWTATATSYDISFKNCWFINNTTDGLFLENTQRVRVEDCYFYNNTQDGFTLSGTTVDTQIINSMAWSNGHDGFDGTAGSKFSFTGNISRNNTSHGINASTDLDNGEIVGNTVYDNAGEGISLSGADKISIGNNVSFSNSQNGIGVSNGDHISITGNILYENAHNGVDFNDCDNSIIGGGNIIFNNSQSTVSSYHGILLRSNSDNNVIFGNSIFDNQGTTTQGYGINESSGANNVLGINYFSANTTGDIKVGSDAGFLFLKASPQSSEANTTEGIIAYADSTNWNPGSGEGPYVYENGAWVSLKEQGASNFSDLAGSATDAQIPNDISLLVSALLQGGANTGDPLEWNGSAWAPGIDAGASSGASVAFKTISGDTGGNAVADEAEDTLTISGGNGIDVVTSSDESVTISGETATLTNPGIVEIATTTETIAGTDATRAVSPDGLTDALDALSFSDIDNSATDAQIPDDITITSVDVFQSQRF